MLGRREFLGTGLAALLPATGLYAGAPPKKSCILLSLVGGPSHLDTWDPKPDAPSHIRGPFRPIRTNVPGIEISEVFPRMARHADQFALIRSCHHDGAALHDAGHLLMQTGRCADEGGNYPHLGSVAARVNGLANYLLPFRIGTTGGNLPSAQTAGEIGHIYEPTLITACSFELKEEPEDTRRRYGLNLFGQSCLMARRLVESGPSFVTVNMFESVFGETTWDSHGSKPFSSIADYRDHVGPMFDQAYSALLEDLQQRGLLETTLVAGIGEFGRSPKINPSGGRDHWPQCFTIHLAGGGIRGGQVFGSSDRHGAEPKENPVNPAMIAATIYQALDVRFAGELLLRPAAEPIHALFV